MNYRHHDRSVQPPKQLHRPAPYRLIILSAVTATEARLIRLRQFRFSWPILSADMLASATRWLMLAVTVAGLAWLVFGVLVPSVARRAEQEVE